MAKHILGLKSFISIVIALFVFGFCNDAKATHLIGGNIGYEYIGADTINVGNDLYKITLDSYMDCNSSAWGGTFPENSVGIGIYEGILNPTSSISNTIQLTLFLVDSNAVDPNLPPICNPFNLLGSVCVYLVRYEGTISLPTSNLGYWVVYDRCCRPGGIINLNNSGGQSFAYTTWVPADTTGLITNTTAQFSDTLLSYICRTDTAYISNNAIDPDGDSLVYTLVDPFQGKTSSGNPTANYAFPPFDPYAIPPPIVTYAGGYNLANLLGTGSYSATNPQTGLTKFLTNNAGVFVAAVEITEYRNGQVVGVTRRNMQLISDDCPNNNMPMQDVSVLDPSAISPTTYQVNAGDSFCFSLNYFDLDTDLLEFSATGDIFDPLLTSPAATVTSPIAGVGSVTGTICWGTSCAQGSPIPYAVDVVVVDSNCPPLPFPHQVLIYVNPFVGLNNVFGDSIICVTNTPSVFTTDFISGVTYTWTITNGSLVSGAGSPTAGVIWNNTSTTGVVSVTATNPNGCTIGPITKTVFLSNVVADAGPDVSVCNDDSIQIGGSPTSLNIDNTITWGPSSTLNFDTVANPMATPTVNSTYTVTLTNSYGCIGYDTVNVTVNNLQPSDLLNEYYVCPGDSAQPLAVGSVFAWSPNQYISDSTLADPLFFPIATTDYILNYLDSNSCPGADTITVTVNENVPTYAGPDAEICIGDSVTLGGNPTSPPNTTFSWLPTTNLNSPTDSNPVVTPTTTTTYIVNTFNDTCTGVDTITIIVNQLPSLTLPNDTIICIGDSTQLVALGTGSFVWDNAGSLSNDSIANPIAFPVTGTVYNVILTDSNGCVSEDSIQLDIQNLPLIDAGGIINACKLQAINIGGFPTGPTNSTYVWSPGTYLSDTTLANPIFNSDQDMVYLLVVTDSLGCVSEDSVEVLVFSAQGLGDTVLCADQKYVLSTTLTNGVGPFTYNWTNSGDLSNANSGSPYIYTGASSNYTVTVTDANSCSDTVEFNINLLASTQSSFTQKTTITCDGVVVKVTNESSDAVEYDWQINYETVSTDVEPDLLFPYGQDATLTLITTSADGCTDTAEIIIPSPKFEDAINIETSNVFTPNGDGENDYFMIKSAGDLSACAELNIYNRNGALVYQSTGGIFSWDGYSSTGKPFPEGVYYYTYSVNGIEHHGNISLLR